MKYYYIISFEPPVRVKSADKGKDMRGVRGFTLVELLVVIAIISILASLLLPTLQNARVSTYNSSCVNNLRQINTAMLNYENEFDDYLPFPADIYEYPGTSPVLYATWINVLAPYLDLSGRPSYHYNIEGGIRGPLKCPTAEDYYHPKLGKTSKSNSKITYGWNPVYHTGGIYEPTSWMQKRNHPSGTSSRENLIMIADGNNPTISSIFDPEKTEYGIFLRHSGGANYLFRESNVKSSKSLHLIGYNSPWR